MADDKQQKKKTSNLPPGAIGETSDGRPIIPKQGESPEHARERLEHKKHK